MEGIRKLDSFSNLVNCLTNSTFSICVSKLKTHNILFNNWQSRKFWVFPQKGVVWKSEMFFKIAWKNHMITWYITILSTFGGQYWAILDWIHLVGVIKKVGNTVRVNFFHFRHVPKFPFAETQNIYFNVHLQIRNRNEHLSLGIIIFCLVCKKKCKFMK